MLQRISTLFMICLALSWLSGPAKAEREITPPQAPAANTYYVSSSQGSDSYNGLSASSPFASIQKVNSLALQPGDQVLFKCGDVWRADPLNITRSGSSSQPITFGSYPAGCANQPLLSGAQPIAGWSPFSGNIYRANLSAGANAGKFTLGVNQLFRNGQRLREGRWPNLDAGDGGYSTIDAQPAANRFSDSQLPAGNWSGAIAHIRGMRWYLLNRQVTGTSGSTLTVGANLDCWNASCSGWGYFLNHHLNTLDQDGEWYYDAGTQQVYLYSSSGSPADGEVEGSVILHADDRSWGGVELGTDLDDAVAYVTVENLAIRSWFRHGIATPTNLHAYENHDLLLQGNTISDVDGIGINLSTWVYDALDGQDGWRGGHNLTVSGNTIRGANHMGINSSAKVSSITDNLIQDVGLIENLGASGMGCSLSASGGACTEDGDGIRIKGDVPADSGNNNSITGNRLERIAYNGMDVFGYQNTIQRNVIHQACYAKGDCGGVRTFGSGSLGTTPVHDLLFYENIILDTIGNTDGCLSTYDALFGFGLYIDNYSRDVTISSNTIISSTASGILYQNSTGSITANTLYNNSRGSMYSAQINLTGSPTYVASQTNNVLYSLRQNAWTLAAANRDRIGVSDYNYFFNPYLSNHISAQGTKSLAQWQAYSGKDPHSLEAWFQRTPGDPPGSLIFYNDTPQPKIFDLGSTAYLDLDQNSVSGSLTLPPFRSKVLVASGELADLVLTMNITGSADTNPNAPVAYTLTVSNQGTLTASGVVLTDIVPAEITNTTWSASSGSVSLQPGTRYVWNLPDLAQGESVVLTVSGAFASSLASGTPLAVVGEASTQTPEASSANNGALLRFGDWLEIHLPLVKYLAN